jgi:hypothetical protein
MNRIRATGNKYQVLITPDYIHSTGFEVLLDNWTDASFNSFYIMEFDNLQDALDESLNHPDIDWYKLISHHVEIYKRLKKYLGDLLNKYNYNVEFKPNLITPEELKNSFFDRVNVSKKSFNVTYGLNDIITFNVLHPWSKNLDQISKNLEKDKELRIKATHIKDNAIYLTGITDIGTTYSIVLMPLHIYSTLRWIMKNRNNTNAENVFEQVYNKAMDQQQYIDKDPLTL